MLTRSYIIELFPALEKLPNLVNLTFSKIPNDIIDDLAKLTQLMVLFYWNGYKKELRTKLPFHVVFVGDPFASVDKES